MPRSGMALLRGRANRTESGPSPPTETAAGASLRRADGSCRGPTEVPAQGPMLDHTGPHRPL